jgi:hypothetical protein
MEMEKPTPSPRPPGARGGRGGAVRGRGRVHRRGSTGTGSGTSRCWRENAEKPKKEKAGRGAPRARGPAPRPYADAARAPQSLPSRTLAARAGARPRRTAHTHRDRPTDPHTQHATTPRRARPTRCGGCALPLVRVTLLLLRLADVLFPGRKRTMKRTRGARGGAGGQRGVYESLLYLPLVFGFGFGFVLVAGAGKGAVGGCVAVGSRSA